MLHGARSYLLQDPDGQILPAHSVAPGLDYPGVGPEHSMLKDNGRVEYLIATDDDASGGVHGPGDVGGHPARPGVVARGRPGRRPRPTIGKGGDVLVCLSGRGDKDVDIVAGVIGL